MRVSPMAREANIRARWEIDLSPGTRMVPESAVARWAVSMGERLAWGGQGEKKGPRGFAPWTPTGGQVPRPPFICSEPGIDTEPNVVQKTPAAQR